MQTRSPSYQLLLRASEKLGTICERVVFVGGSVTCLLVTDNAAPEVRATEDIDLIVEVVTQLNYHKLEDELRGYGFSNDLHSHIGRFNGHGLILDVMAADLDSTGQINRWYPEAIKQKVGIQLDNNKTIWHISAPLFLATKLEAHANRGQDDPFASKDLTDIISVFDGRDTIMGEVHQCTKEVREFIGNELYKLLSLKYFDELLSGHLPADTISQQRRETIVARMKSIHEHLA